MRYSIETSLRELVVRGRRIRMRRARRITWALQGMIAVLAALIVVSFTALGETDPTFAGTTYGAYLLPGEAGGYVLAGTVAFVAGVAFTLFCTRYAQKHRDARWDRMSKAPSDDVKGD